MKNGSLLEYYGNTIEVWLINTFEAGLEVPFRALIDLLRG